MVAGLAGASLSTAWEYNRANFVLDATLKQQEDHQKQNMAVSRWTMYRDDLRDLFNLTISKMDAYKVVGALLFGFAINFTLQALPSTEEGEPPPAVFVAVYVNGVLEMVVYGLLCVWFATNGSIAAHSASVRLLTRYVRLPVASSADISAVRIAGTDCEKLENMAGMFRLPFLQTPPKKGEDASAKSDAPKHETREDGGCEPFREVDHAHDHLRLFNRLQENWMAFDAYARIASCFCANGALTCISSYLGGYLFLTVQQVVTGWVGTVTPILTSVLLFRIDLYVPTRVIRRVELLGLLNGLVFALAMHCKLCAYDFHIEEVTFCYPVRNEISYVLSVLAVLLKFCWLNTLSALAVPEPEHWPMPSRFRSAIYLDMAGGREALDNASSVSSGPRLAASPRASSASPGPGCRRRPTIFDAPAPEVARWCVDDAREELELLVSELMRGVLPEATVAQAELLLRDLGDLRGRLHGGSFVGGEGAAESSNPFGDWVAVEEESDFGTPVTAYIHLVTGEVQWAAPARGQILDLQGMLAQVRSLKQESDDERRRASLSSPPPSRGLTTRSSSSTSSPYRDPLLKGWMGGVKERSSKVDGIELSSCEVGAAARAPEGGHRPAERRRASMDPRSMRVLEYGFTYSDTDQHYRPGSQGEKPGEMPLRFFFEATKLLRVIWALTVFLTAMYEFFRIEPHIVFATVTVLRTGASVDASVLACWSGNLTVADSYGRWFQLGSRPNWTQPAKIATPHGVICNPDCGIYEVFSNSLVGIDTGITIHISPSLQLLRGFRSVSCREAEAGWCVLVWTETQLHLCVPFASSGPTRLEPVAIVSSRVPDPKEGLFAADGGGQTFELLPDGYDGGVLLARAWRTGAVLGKWGVARGELSDAGYEHFPRGVFPKGPPESLSRGWPVGMCARRGEDRRVFVTHTGVFDVKVLGPFDVGDAADPSAS